ncbi:MAG TPA: YfhO family protein [Longimicrobiales bacterium]|nr:YfhO family protein [Longimicrobiales bacterium]
MNRAKKRDGAKAASRTAAANEAAPGPWPSWGLAALLYLGAAVVYFLPAFLPGRHIYGSDYLAGSYPFHVFISERFADGALPKWVPSVYGGLPLFSNPGSTFHPFRFLADLLFPAHRIFPAIYVLQFWLAGLGTYLLSRELGVRAWAALVVGFAFQFTGITMSAVLGGHEGRIIVATMTPMVLFLLHRGVRTGRPVWFAGAALAIGSALLSFQIQSSYYLLLLGAAWGVFSLVRTRVRGARPVSARVALGLGAVAVAFLLAAVNFLPFLAYVDQSPRGEGGRGYEYATSWAMPPAEITGLAVPEHVGLLEHYEGGNAFKLHTEYVGAVVLLLAALGAYYNRRDRYWWFFAAAAVVALTFSFGGHTPVYRLYYALLPGTRQFRAPSVSFFVVSISLVMMAGLALERLARLRAEVASADDPRLRPATIVIGAAAAITLLILLVAGGGGGEPRARAFSAGAFRFAGFTWLAGGLLWAWLRRSVGTRVVVAALALLTVADLWIVDRRFFSTVESPDLMYAADEVVDFLGTRPERNRVWVLPGAFQGGAEYGGGLKNYLMLHGVDQTGGEHGNQLQRYNQYVGAGDRTYVDWHNLVGDLQTLLSAPTTASSAPAFLAAANIRYILSMVPLPGLPEAFRGRTGLVYEVPGALPRAYLVGETVVAAEPGGALDILARPDFDPATTAVLYEDPGPPLAGDGPFSGSATVLAYEPDRVDVRTRADRDALLVLADNYYAGWTATVDGEPAEVIRANHTFRGVRVPAGEHTVTFEFRPAEVYMGLWLGIGALFILLAAGCLDVLLRHRRLSAAA